MHAPLTAIALTCVLVAQVAAATPDLSPRFQPGAVARYRLTEEVKQETYGKDQAKPASSKSGTTQFDVKLVCLSYDAAKGGDFTLVYESVKMKAETPMGPMEYDSTIPENPADPSMLAPAFKPLLGVALKVTVDGAGAIVSAVPEKPFPSPQPRTIGRYTEVRAMNLTFAPLFGLRPASVDKDAQSWSVESTMALAPGASVAIKEVFTLGKVSPESVELSSSGTASIPPPASMPMKDMKITSDRGGRFEWNTSLGRLASSKRTETTTIQGAVEEGPIRNVTTKVETLEAIAPASTAGEKKQGG